jgi:hypothetical protein
MPTQTLNEKFEAYRSSPDYPYRDTFKTLLGGEPVNVIRIPLFEDREQAAFIAGAKAEREEVLEILRDLRPLAPSTSSFNQSQAALWNEIERRIKERHNG